MGYRDGTDFSGATEDVGTVPIARDGTGVAGGGTSPPRPTPPPNLPISKKYITNAKYIFGPDLSGLKYKILSHNQCKVGTKYCVTITSYF